MFQIVLTWVVGIAVLIGIGLSVRRVFRLREPSADDVLVSFWLGWVAVLAALQVWHLFLPVGPAATSLVVGLGVAGLLWNGSDLLRCMRRIDSRGALVLCGFVLLSVWLANRAIGEVHPYDAGLYHINTIRWIGSYPIVPGLGNLHGRLAFNSSWFLFMALLDVGPWSHLSHHVANGMLLTVIGAQVGLSVMRLTMDRSAPGVRDIFMVLMIIPLSPQCFQRVSSTNVETSVILLGIVTVARLLGLLCMPSRLGTLTPTLSPREREENGRPLPPGGGGAFAQGCGEPQGDRGEVGDVLDAARSEVFTVFLVVMFSAASVALRPGLVVMGFLTAMIVLFRFVLGRWRKAGKGRVIASVVALCLPAAAIVATWVIRSYVLCGYPMYPCRFGGIDVDWRVTEAQVDNEIAWTRSWARKENVPPDQVLGDWRWFGPWAIKVAHMGIDVSFAVIALAIGLALHLGGRRATWAPWRVLFFLPPTAGLVFWFAVAPAPRFAGIAFWWLGGGALALGICRFAVRPRRVMGMTALVSCCLIALLAHRTDEKFLEPGPLRGLYPLREPELRTFTTDSGLEVLVPIRGDRCFDAPLPCTPYPRRKLELRRPDALSGGFRMRK